MRILTFLILSLLVSACVDRSSLAPVVEANWRAFNPNASQYVVVKGDTLYSIAFRYDQDFRQLANYNHLRSPYTLSVGQVLRIQQFTQRSSRPQQAKSVAQPTYYTPTRLFNAYRSRHQHWLWPAQGRVVTSFVPQQGKKGIDIAGRKGDKIYASVGGVVAYAGNGLPGYGNLIIIKHDNQYLTAYGHNERNLVREGQMIRAGQVIAEMGVVDRKFYGVHFEIRQAGHPVNPLNYL